MSDGSFWSGGANVIVTQAACIDDGEEAPMPATRIVLPAKARKGEVIEIKTIIKHEMETGFRRDNVGLAIPRDIITLFTFTYAGAESVPPCLHRRCRQSLFRLHHHGDRDR